MGTGFRTYRSSPTPVYGKSTSRYPTCSLTLRSEEVRDPGVAPTLGQGTCVVCPNVYRRRTSGVYVCGGLGAETKETHHYTSPPPSAPVGGVYRRLNPVTKRK